MILLFLACVTAPAPAPEPAPAEPTTWDQVALTEGGVREDGAIPWKNAAGAIACPVMGTAIDSPKDAVSYTDHKGIRYFFCCDSCEKLFLEDPEAYANGKYVDEHALDPTAPAACAEG